MEPVAETRGLERTFESPDGGEICVLRGVDLTIEPGDSIAIVGPSGSGKSTLLHLLGALDRPTAGDVLLGGSNVAELDDLSLAALRNRYVGFVFQFHHLLRDFTALENVMVPQLVAGVSREDARSRARELLDQVGLLPRESHRPRKLSGGEQQRVAVARALANDPPLLLADEPSGNLDVEASERLHDLLFEMLERHKSAMVVVTHSGELASRADQTLRLGNGRLHVT
ncbi:MAG: ABC transporter ATP-binding protein [Gemmatimonadota bacterium]|nr:ABC transporter ATP-binding protein [Gemmatimonadota bacterium]